MTPDPILNLVSRPSKAMGLIPWLAWRWRGWKMRKELAVEMQKFKDGFHTLDDVWVPMTMTREGSSPFYLNGEECQIIAALFDDRRKPRAFKVRTDDGAVHELYVGDDGTFPGLTYETPEEDA